MPHHHTRKSSFKVHIDAKAAMTRFRPCIDLHAGQVKQIVGGTLTPTSTDLKTNHVSKQPASHFAQLYKDNALAGAHVIMLGPGNEEAAKQALAAWPHCLQVGGGITDKNARQWIDWGADKIIITSYLFPDAQFSMDRLQAVLHALGDDKSKLVIDLSCRKKGTSWFVAMNKWQTLTNMEINQGANSPAHARQAFDDTNLYVESIDLLQPWCSEFLIHAADNEGLQRGIDEELVQKLAAWCLVPVTYAGGAHSLEDLDRVKALSAGKVDLTIGSALDIFGGDGVKFVDCVKWDREQEAEGPFRNQT